MDMILTRTIKLYKSYIHQLFELWTLFSHNVVSLCYFQVFFIQNVFGSTFSVDCNDKLYLLIFKPFRKFFGILQVVLFLSFYLMNYMLLLFCDF